MQLLQPLIAVFCMGALLTACQAQPDLEECSPSLMPLTLGGEDFTGHVLTATVTISEGSRQAALAIGMDSAGARKLAAVTQARLGQAMRFEIDGQLVSEPVVREVITGGQVMVTGNLDADEMAEISAQLSRTCD